MNNTNKEDRPDPKVRERHLSFIHANWDQLASAAYHGFKERGRGMIMLDDRDFIDKPRGRFTKFRMAYVAEGSDELNTMEDRWPGKKEAGWVEGYNPSKTVLVCFTRKDGGVSSYKVDGVGDRLPVMLHGLHRGDAN